MVSLINPKPNTFYKAKNLDDDIGAMPVYGDAYVGNAPTYDLISSPDTTYYLGEATVITENDFVYGEGTLTECYLNLYANSFTQVNQQTAPWIDVYGIKSNIDLIEGDLFRDTTVGDISVYSSIYDMETPWIVEDFDGSNKFFYDAPSRWQPGYASEDALSLFIVKNDYMSAVYSTHEGATDNHSGYTFSNAWEEIVHAVDYGESKAAQGAQGFVNWLGREVVAHPLGMTGGGAVAGAAYGASVAGPFGVIPGALVGGIAGGMAGQVYADGLQELTLTKHSNGLYYWTTPTHLKNKELGSTTKHLVQNRISEGHSKSWWLARGAWAVKQGGTTNAANIQYDTFDETFIAHCDQYNSIFSEVFRRGMARDIKTETIGSSGDDPKFFAYVSADLVSSDTASEGNAFKMKLFWENYSGTTIGSDDPADVNYKVWDDANYFGYNSTLAAEAGPSPASTGDSVGSKHPLPQCIFGSIDNIPAPSLYDVTTPSFSSSAVPELEFVFKIEQMPTLPYITSGSEGPGSASFDPTSYGRELSRTFTISFSQRRVASGSSDPQITENVTDHCFGSYLGTYRYPMLILSCFKLNEGNNIDVLGIFQQSGNKKIIDVNTTANNLGYGGTSLRVFPEQPNWTADGWDEYHTTIPEGKWVTMRLKFGNNPRASGSLPSAGTHDTDTSGDVIAYFPDLKDEDGKMRMLKVYSPVPLSPRYGFFPDCLTLWANNMRSINEIPNYSTWTDGYSLHINNGYTKIDDVTNDDKIVEVLIDKIGFYGWNTLTNNASVTIENGMGDMMKMPNVTGIPVANPNEIITVASSEEDGSDNIYGGFTQPLASYLSFGYDSSGTAQASVQNHKLLFNDFFTAQPSTVSQIPYMKAGYFTATNYAGSGSEAPSQWFSNLSIGGNSTDNLQVGGAENYIDGFSQKGLMGVSSSFAGWVKTGNPYVAAKILTISDDGTQITVDKPQIFNTSEDQEFVVEREGIGIMGFSTLNGRDSGPFGYGCRYEEYLAGSGSKGYVLPLTQNQPKRDNIIFLSDSILYDDQGEKLGKVGLATGNLYDDDWESWNSASRIRISPKKYWMNIAYVNVASAKFVGGLATVGTPKDSGSGYDTSFGFDIYEMSSSTGTGSGASIWAARSSAGKVYVARDGWTFWPMVVVTSGSGYAVGDRIHFMDPDDATNQSAYVTVGTTAGDWGHWYGETSGGSATPLAPRSYNTVLPVSGGATRGTTFNETQYNDGVYANRWDLDFTDPNSRYVINTIDYSYGVVEELEEGEAPLSLSTGGGRGYMARDFLLSGQNYISLNNYIRMNKPNFGDDFNFMVVPTYMNTQESSYRVNFNTDDATTNVPQLVYGIRDMPPVISDFRVKPSVNFLQQDADIYNITKAGATDVSFEWKEEANIWYRMLFIDTTTIPDKYHRARFWAPLNESGDTHKYRYGSGLPTQASFTTVTGTLSGDIEGFQGYGAKFDGTTSIETGVVFGTLGLHVVDEFTLCAHCVPSVASGTIVDLLGGGSSYDSMLKIYLSGSKIYTVIEGVGTPALISSSTVTSYLCDGVEPLSIIISYDKERIANHYQLYVNNKLEDAITLTTAGSLFSLGNGYVNIGGITSGAIYSGSGGDTGHFTGFIEEVVMYDKAYYVVPNANQYTLNTLSLVDQAAGKSKAYQARLFAFDYHNIRGKGRTNVGRSSQAAWKVTAV